MQKWLYFLMSIGSIFILIYPSEIGAKEHLILGLFLIVVPGIYLFTKKRKN